MRCPNCESLDTQVRDSRPSEDYCAIRRRRICLTCEFRFTTFERVQLRELVVIKRGGRRAPFDRDKLLRSLEIALRKRPIASERVDELVSKIVRDLEVASEGEVTSKAIGEAVMKQLRELDDVAYVRFASVYRNFREAKDFKTVLGEFGEDVEAVKPPAPTDAEKTPETAAAPEAVAAEKAPESEEAPKTPAPAEAVRTPEPAPGAE